MPNLEFGIRGAEAAINAQDRLNAKIANLEKKYDDANRSSKELKRNADAAIRSQTTHAEALQKKIAAIRMATGKGLVDDKAATAAIARIQAKMAALEGTSERVSNAAGKHFGSKLVGKLGPALAGFASIQAVIGRISDEVRAQLALIDQTNSTQQTVAESRNEVVRNTTGMTLKQRQAIIAQNSALASRVQVSETFINQARAKALSASSGDVGASLDATRVAAIYNRGGNEAAIGDYAGSLLDVSRATGTKDAITNLGLLSKIGGLSRVTDARAQAQTIPQSLINARAFGLSTQEGAALYSTITAASGDTTGATSKTAITRFAEQLQTSEALKQFGSSSSDRFRGLLNNQGAAKSFFDTLSVDAAAKGAIRGLLLDPSSDARRTYKELLSQIPSDNRSLRRAGEQELAAFGANTLLPVQRTSQGLRSLVEQARLGDSMALGADDREALREILLRSGRSNLGAKGRILLDQLDDGGRITYQEAADRLESEANRIGNPRTESYGGYNVGGTVTIDPTEEQKTLAKLMQNFVELAREQIDATNDQTRTLGEEFARGGLQGSPN